jgi:nucleotide-binding universal stress UspA family protein
MPDTLPVPPASAAAIARLAGALEAIEKEAELWRPDLMVFTTEGHRDFFDALRGSTTERVLRASHCPVLAVPAKEL